jgi:site-specific recombinase XerD
MYQTAVKEFLTYQSKRGKTSIEFTQNDMAVYYEYLTTRNNKRGSGTLSQTTINHHLFAIRLLFDYLLETNKVKAVPAIPKFLRGLTGEMEIITVEQVKQLYKACENELETAILSAAYGAGLRRSEIEALNITDVLLRDGILIVKQGKNSKRREVPLSDKVVQDLKNYLHNYRTIRSKDRRAFFINKVGKRMSGASLNNQVKRIRLRTDIRIEVTLHTLRRSIATHLIENGAGIYFLKEFLGHSQIDTSHLYAIKRKRQTRL